MAFYLGDDGTLDTVIVCRECGAELRYSYDPSMEEWDYGHEPTEIECQQAYDDFVDWAIEDAEDSHICGEDE